MYKWTLIITFQYINIKHFITLCLGLLVGIQPSVKYWLLAVEGQSGNTITGNSDYIYLEQDTNPLPTLVHQH